MRTTILVCVVIALLWQTFCSAYTVKYKVKKMNEQLTRDKSSVLVLNDQLYNVYTEEPRNYSIVLLATALDPKIGCDPCRKFDPEFRMVASSHMSTVYGGSSNPVYFAIIDFADGRNTFASLGLQSAPIVFHIPPTEGPNGRGANAKFDRWDASSLTADMMAIWVNGVANVQIKITKPLDYQKIAFFVTSALFGLAMIKIIYSKFQRILNNQYVWAVLSLLFIVNMSSGYMWNQIRNTPYSGMDNGRIQLIMPGGHGQYQIETQLVAGIYGLLSACVVFLVNRVPQFSSGAMQRLAVFITMGVFVATYSVLISLFRMKQGDYPFSLLL